MLKVVASERGVNRARNQFFVFLPLQCSFGYAFESSSVFHRVYIQYFKTDCGHHEDRGHHSLCYIHSRCLFEPLMTKENQGSG